MKDQFRDLMIDLLFVAGLTLFSYGVWRISEPAVFIVVGAVLMGLPTYYVVKARGNQKIGG